MANTINDNQKEAKQDWFDCPEPSKDFNQTVKETKVKARDHLIVPVQVRSSV